MTPVTLAAVSKVAEKCLYYTTLFTQHVETLGIRGKQIFHLMCARVILSNNHFWTRVFE